jgi:argininosuccinate synthase
MPDSTRALKLVEYSVYADLPRPLTADERLAVGKSLDANVPGSGCVGPQKGPNDEIYFSVEAHSDEDATAKATRYLKLVALEAGLNSTYTIEVQRRGGSRAAPWPPPI